VKAILNGKATEIVENTSILDLVLSRNLEAEAIIVALNDKVIKRDQWIDTTINEGDCLELVSLVGGG